MSTNEEKYLVLRGVNKDIYFIQKRLTKAQSEALGKDFIKKSLETTDINVARQKRDEILKELDEISNKIDDKSQNFNNYSSENDNNSEKELKLENLSVPTPEKEVNSIYEYKDSSRYTIFSLKVPKFPEKDDLIVKIDSIIPITILILTLFIAFIV